MITLIVPRIVKDATSRIEIKLKSFDHILLIALDKVHIFFGLKPMYNLLMPNEGKKNIQVSNFSYCLCECCRIHKMPCTLICKPKATACIKYRKYISQMKP